MMFRKLYSKIISYCIGLIQSRHQKILLTENDAYKKKLGDKWITPTRAIGAFKQLRKEIKLVFEISHAWWNKEYKVIPYGSLIIITGAITYLIFPLDALPDFIPIAGFIDDAVVLGLTYHQIRTDLYTFEEWKINQRQDET